MSRAARFFWVCAASSVLCFVALAILSKGSLEPDGLLIFDSRVGGYDVEDARSYLQALPGEQTMTYLTTFRRLDTLFPVLLTVSLLGAIWLNTGREPTQRRVIACFAPVAYLTFDLLENATVAQFMMREGQVTFEALAGPWDFDTVVTRASTYTQAKWMTLALSLLVVVWAWRFAAKEPAA